MGPRRNFTAFAAGFCPGQQSTDARTALKLNWSSQGRAPLKQLKAGVVLVAALMMARPWTSAFADAGPFSLPTAGCPMAHCVSRLSNAVGLLSPAVASEVFVDKSSGGSVGGLGCVSNTRFVACTGGSNPTVHPNLTVYDADGNHVWDDAGLLGSTAWFSAALISDTNQVIAADQQRLIRVDPIAGSILWQSLKPDTGTPISPVLVGSDASMVLLATKADSGQGTPELSVWDVATGALLAHQPIVDPVTGVLYATINTPAVKGNRAYVLSTAVGNSNDGRLYAIDICESNACGGRGSLNFTWKQPFDGPASASPLLIGNRLFFDGLRGRSMGLYYGVDELGDSAAQVWIRKFPSRFGFNAAQDPRGGLWISPWQSGTLIRVSETNGSNLQTISIGAILGLDPSYSPVTAVSASTTATGAIVLTSGVQTKSPSIGIGPHVAAIDVSSLPSGTGLWKYKVSASQARNSATGQFPIVINSVGARRIVFRGTTSSTFFIGEP
jgi:hypothetical protein